MSLPKVATDFETVEVAGAVFDLRGISRAEAARFQKMAAGPSDALEIAVIAAATDTPADEVKEWYAATPSWAVEELLGHVKRMSRLDGEAYKSG